MYSNRVVVYTSGTFDMFHSNHLKMIEYAKGLGDTLIVGVSTDDLVASYKKPPIIPPCIARPPFHTAKICIGSLI